MAARRKRILVTIRYEREIQEATQAALQAAAEIRSHFGAGDSVEYKAEYEPVTAADVLADQILRERLQAAFPEYGWLSEETQDDGERLGADRVWVVDPLDGTREFIKGLPEFCVSIGLMEQGVPVAAIIINPVTQELWTAERGHGARLNGTLLRVSDCDSVAQATAVVSRNETRRGLLTPFEDLVALEPLGGMVSKLVAVANGSADATFTCYQRREWDVAAGALLLTEAGGRITKLDGTDLQFNQRDTIIQGIVASNGRMHDDLRDQIAAINAAQDSSSI